LRKRKKSGVRRLKNELRHGNPSAEILRLAMETQAGLIILGFRETHAVRKALAANVVEKVIRNAVIPIWIAKS
jgi:nucleotide-binding universal stress UspA family protein